MNVPLIKDVCQELHVTYFASFKIALQSYAHLVALGPLGDRGDAVYPLYANERKIRQNPQER